MTPDPKRTVRLTLPEDRADCARCARQVESSPRADGCHGSATWQVRRLMTACPVHTSALLRLTLDEVVVEVKVRTEESDLGRNRPTSTASVMVILHSVAIDGGPMDELVLAAATRLASLTRFGDEPDSEMWGYAWAGFAEPFEVADAHRALMTPREACDWAEVLASGRASRRGATEGPLPAGSLLGWYQAGAEEGLGMWDAAAWVAVGVEDASARPPGLSAGDVQVLNGARVDDRDAQWAGVEGVCPSLVVMGLDLGADPAAIVTLFTALADDDDLGVWCGGCGHPRAACGWGSGAVAAAAALASALPDRQCWGDVATCLSAGLGVAQSVQYATSGADMAPVRLMAALSR